jgi:hypothetical protein
MRLSDRFDFLAIRCNLRGIFLKTLGKMLDISWTEYSEACRPTTSGQCPELAAEWKRFWFSSRVEAVYVLHVFQKKTRATAKRDLDVARLRHRQLDGGR